MNLRSTSLAALIAVPFVVAGVFACGEDGQAIGENQCPTIPIYHWEHDGGTWFRVDENGNIATKAPSLKYTTDPSNPDLLHFGDPAFKDLDNNGRCATPPGYATSIDQATGGATGAAGAGGASGAAGASGAGGKP